MDEIQAGILSLKLDYLDRDNRIRNSLANEYLSRITNKRIVKPQILDANISNWHLFVVRTEERGKFINYLEKNDIQTMIHYPIPPHKQPAYKELSNNLLPITEEIHKTIVSLPMSQAHSLEMIRYVSDVINDYN